MKSPNQVSVHLSILSDFPAQPVSLISRLSKHFYFLLLLHTYLQIQVNGGAPVKQYKVFFIDLNKSPSKSTTQKPVITQTLAGCSCPTFFPHKRKTLFVFFLTILSPMSLLFKGTILIQSRGLKSSMGSP